MFGNLRCGARRGAGDGRELIANALHECLVREKRTKDFEVDRGREINWRRI